ncbi:hypothetical protein [Brytella acorum]|uniref:Uncharacterized protein n=1 Tax=Brytella acorum TaxID=2959299 RepID=A0AA35Y4X2_9PROT|nr:hypothetical protein [Brytella acorum]CAI9122281.1 hypothetical protein LMG32879_003141 [Brytella acorum]
MLQTTTETIADVDRMVARLEAYRLELEARPVIYGYAEPASREDIEEEAGFRFPTRPPRPRHAPRPPGTGKPFSLAGIVPPEPETSQFPPPFNAQPDWLYHVLTVTGPEMLLARFREAAAGNGRLSWEPHVTSTDDLAQILPVRDARIAVLLDRIVQSQKRLLEHDAASGPVPFDLNTLCPLPWDILSLGPASPVTQTWLWQHWGTSQPLRQVEEMMGRPNETRTRWSITFWSADWTPWAALQTVATLWPDLTFFIRPLYNV